MSHTLNTLRDSLIAAAAASGDAGQVKSILSKTARRYRQSVKDQALLFASEAGHEKLVKDLLRRGASIGCYIDTSITPLHLAVRNHHLHVADILIKKSRYASPLRSHSHRPGFWMTALHVTAEVNDTAIAELLLAAGVPVDHPFFCPGCRSRCSACEDKQRTAVAAAARHGSTDMLRLLIARGANPMLHLFDRTLLHLAAQGGHTGTIRFLLEGGACPCVDMSTDYQKNTPVRLAVENGHQGAVELLLVSGARLDEPTRNARGSLILEAVRRRSVGIVKVLLRYPGLEIYCRATRQALEAAVHNLDHSIMRCLFTYYGVLFQGRFEPDVPRCTEIHPNQTRREILRLRVQILRDACYIVGHADDRSTLMMLTPPKNKQLRKAAQHGALMGAISVGNMPLVQSLLAEGAKVSGYTATEDEIRHLPLKEQRTRYHPLNAAAYYNRPDICELLLNHSPQIIRMSGPRGETALHIAVAGDHAAIARMLIERGANVNSKESNWVTPLHCVRGSVEMARLLLSNGADVQGDTDGLMVTPCVYSAQREHQEVMELLIARGAKDADIAREICRVEKSKWRGYRRC